MNPPKNFNPEPFAYHHELELTIDTLTNLGVGLGRVDGWVVMVPFALPGERVRVRIYRNTKSYSDADLMEVLEPSPERVAPVCPLFGECGGCQYQHLSYAAQRGWKTQQVRELMERLGGIEVEVQPCIGSPKEYHYRSKLTPHYPKKKNSPEFPIGFLRQGTRQHILDVPQCPIGTEEINAEMPDARAALRKDKKAARRGGTLLLRHVLEGVVTDNNAIVSERIGKVIYQFQAGEFFQNNPFILPTMVDYVIGEARGERSGVEPPRYLVDAYCGVGVFSLQAAAQFEQCAGVEVSASAIQWANTNAKINRIQNCEFLIGQAENIFGKIAFPAEESAVIIDPPRRGCDEAFIAQLAAFSPRRLVYVSCAPDTQARDLKGLMDAGYRVERVQPFDLFPQTRHIENVVTLVRG